MRIRLKGSLGQLDGVEARGAENLKAKDTEIGELKGEIGELGKECEIRIWEAGKGWKEERKG